MKLVNEGKLLETCETKTNTRLRELDGGLQVRLRQAEALIHNAFADVLPGEVQEVYVYNDSEPDAFFLQATAEDLVLCLSSKTATLGLTEQRLILCGAIEDFVEGGPLPELNIPEFNKQCEEAEA